MKCEIKRRVEVSVEEKEKIVYLKKELEKRGLKVKISVDTTEEGKHEEVQYLGREMTKMPELWGMPSLSGISTKILEAKEYMKSREIQNPTEINNPYRSFKELLDGEKNKTMSELKGGKKGGEQVDGMKYELKEVIIKIEVET